MGKGGDKRKKSAPKIGIKIPAGMIGLSFTGKNKPIVSSVRRNSPMDKTIIKVGWIAVALKLGNGTEYTDFKKKELEKLLKDTKEETARILTFAMTQSTVDIELDIPASDDIGFEIIENEDGKPIIWNLSAEARNLHTISSGMILDTAILPNGYEMRAYSTEDFKTLLKRTSHMKGRKVIFKDADSETLSEKSISFSSKTIELPVGDLDDIGLDLIGQKAVVQKVDENSPFKHEIFPGMIAAGLRNPSGADYSNFPAYLLKELLSHTQKMENRMMHFVGPEKYIDEEPILKYYPEVLGVSMNELGITFTNNEFGHVIDKVNDKKSVIHGLDGLILRSVQWRDPSEEESTSKIIESEADIAEALLESAGCNRVFNFGNVETGFMPDEFKTALPIQVKGESLGFKVRGDRAQITHIQDGSFLQELFVTPGMYVSELVANGKHYRYPSAKLLIKKLKKSNDDFDRTQKCVKHLDME